MIKLIRLKKIRVNYTFSLFFFLLMALFLCLIFLFSHTGKFSPSYSFLWALGVNDFACKELFFIWKWYAHRFLTEFVFIYLFSYLQTTLKNSANPQFTTLTSKIPWILRFWLNALIFFVKFVLFFCDIRQNL